MNKGKKETGSDETRAKSGLLKTTRVFESRHYLWDACFCRYGSSYTYTSPRVWRSFTQTRPHMFSCCQCFFVKSHVTLTLQTRRPPVALIKLIKLFHKLKIPLTSIYCSNWNYICWWLDSFNITKVTTDFNHLHAHMCVVYMIKLIISYGSDNYTTSV